MCAPQQTVPLHQCKVCVLSHWGNKLTLSIFPQVLGAPDVYALGDCATIQTKQMGADIEKLYKQAIAADPKAKGLTPAAFRLFIEVCAYLAHDLCLLSPSLVLTVLSCASRSCASRPLLLISGPESNYKVSKILVLLNR